MAMNYINMSSENQTFYGKDMEPGVVQSVPGPINANDFLQINKAPDADVPDDNTDALAKMIENTITAIEFPKSVTKVGNHGLANRNLITTVRIPARITSIGDYGFGDCHGLVTIDIPETCTSIGNYAFTRCAIRTLILPDGATLGTNVCAGCSSLESVHIPESLTELPSNTFSTCTSLRTVDIPDSVEVIGSSAFSGCTSLTSVKLPTSLKTINDHAFFHCDSLSSVSVPEGATKIDNGAFAQSSITSITLPSTLTKLGTLSSGGSMTTGVFGSCASLSSINLEDTSITTICSYTFYACSSLESITIPDTVSTIGEYAFSMGTAPSGGLKAITIPGSVSAIPKGMCSTCNLLTSIKINSGVTTINDSAFSVGGPAGTAYAESCTIDIPSTVTYINSKAFQGRGVNEQFTINIHKASGSISGAPWGATGSKVTINWLG